VKTFIEYLLEAESKSFAESSNLPSANDSTSPINGSHVDYDFAEKLQRRSHKKSNETISHKSK
jgi:hypothetical protein